MDEVFVKSMGKELKHFVAEFDDCFGRMVPKLDHSLRAMFAGQILGTTDSLHDR